jgi:hypothetical protein
MGRLKGKRSWIFIREMLHFNVLPLVHDDAPPARRAPGVRQPGMARFPDTVRYRGFASTTLLLSR